MDIISIVEASSVFLWSIVGFIGGIIMLWFLWQILQTGRQLREYGTDYIGFLRGEIHAAAKEENIEILTPTKTIHERRNRFAKVLSKSKKEM